MKRMMMVGALVLGTATLVYADGKSRIHAGKWHTSVKTDMPGMPFTPPPMEVDRCVSNDEAGDPQKVLKKQAENCELASFKMDGGHVTYSVTCHQHGGTQTGVGDFTFTSESYSGTMTLDMTIPNRGPMKMIQHIQASRTGDCKP
ncbi:MAG TPA: DUF3617 family protein [Polyangia bacterium]|jgi:hypothetical protein|nr:DUF3617 family protein [Polyangia bacterium]HWE27800.1 DUF3617 family protein [Polyangia bacterium]